LTAASLLPFWTIMLLRYLLKSFFSAGHIRQWDLHPQRQCAP
jgi:hypothetical protein